MKIARFWTKASHPVRLPRGRGFEIVCWGWSDADIQEARLKAQERARRAATHLEEQGGGRLDRYGYGEQPLREEILREIKDESGQMAAAITRNSYGCLVLNTAQAMFVDIDLPELERGDGIGGFLKRLFGKPSKPGPEEIVESALTKVEEWTRTRPGWGWRAYRTRAGLRLLATHALFDPADALVQQAFSELDADPLYQRLCKNQRSFRARLTPKPWRCGLGAPPVRWPWADERAEKRFKSWESEYLKKSGQFAACQWLRDIGAAEVAPALASIVELHDRATRASSGLPLA
ncbi:MAG: hypothetical protein J7M29_01280 [Verrucomicrobia bacterium]|nr:hypothetical protein [Verrucomicrobiota bacterium]